MTFWKENDLVLILTIHLTLIVFIMDAAVLIYPDRVGVTTKLG
jgi:hypothetical protein